MCAAELNLVKINNNSDVSPGPTTLIAQIEKLHKTFALFSLFLIYNHDPS